MKVLIIEDAEFMALAIKDALSAQGHEVDWVIGVRSFSPFLGIGEQKQNIELDPTAYDVVLCDGQLPGANQGPDIVANLAARGVKCIGMSSDWDLNNKMVQSGAAAASLKVCIFAAIAEAVLTMEIVQQPQALSDVIPSVNAFAERIRADQTLRRKLDSLIEKHMSRD